MFSKNLWYAAAWRSTLPADKPLAVQVAGEAVVIYRRADGQIAALADRCCHRAAPLSLGRVEGNDLRCMYHGLKFNPVGKCVEIPGQPKIPASACVRQYTVAERDALIWLWPGDPERADTSLIPLTELDRPGWQYRTGSLDYTADYQLLNDNLTDFSHVAFVHENTLGRGSDKWAQELPKVTPLANGVLVERWIAAGEPLPMDPRLHDAKVDLWTRYEYVLPGVLHLAIEYHPLGTAEASGRLPPTTPPIHASYSAQAVTPLDEKTTRYFYSSATRLQDAPEGLEIFFAVSEAAFAEDKIIIEAQQRIMNSTPGASYVNTMHDNGPIRFRRLIEAAGTAEVVVPVAPVAPVVPVAQGATVAAREHHGAPA